MANNRSDTYRYSGSPKHDRAEIEREWEKFMSGSASPLNVNTFMHHSWKRCLEQGVDPLHMHPVPNLGMDQIQEFVTSDPIFRMVEPFLHKLKQLADHTGYLVTYSNASGEVVYYDGDRPLMLKAEDINFTPGSKWGESIAGTNAIGTALVTGGPVQVFASEHFCQQIHGWTCSAAPIRDPGTGQVLGIIDLTGFWTANDPKSLEAVVGTAGNIENMLCNQLRMERYRLAQHYVELTRRSTVPVAVTDRGGRVIKASKLLYEKGWISPNHWMEPASLIKQSFPSKAGWQDKRDQKIWQFELKPFFYGGSAIGSVITVLPPDIAAFHALPDFRHIVTASAPPRAVDTTASDKAPRQDRFYKSLFEHHPDAIFSYDLQGTLLDANPAAEKLLGYDTSELKTITVQHLILPEYRERKLRAFAHAASGMQQEYEAAFRHKQGHRLYVLFKSFPIIVDNEIAGVYETVRDISTNHQQVYEDLKSTKEQLEFYFRNTEDAILVVDADHHIVKANQSFERIYGWTEQELLGKELPTIPEHLRNEGEQIRSSLLSSRHAIPYETVRRRKDGSLIQVSNFATPLFDGKGNAIAYVLISRDITELKQTEQLLRNTEKLAVVGQLAAGIAHEIRNPLTTVKGFLSLLRSQAAHKDNWYMDIMMSEIGQIEWIADQFLTVAKPQIATYAAANLETVIRQVASFLYPMATMSNVQIGIESEAGEPVLPCEPNQLKQVFINIVKNAIEAMPQGGQVDIRITRHPDSISVRVIDYGHGIPEDRIPHLGEPFYTLKEKGTGLGLMICYKIIKEHGGTIRITSEVDRGTTVEIRLPLGGAAAR